LWILDVLLVVYHGLSTQLLLFLAVEMSTCDDGSFFFKLCQIRRVLILYTLKKKSSGSYLMNLNRPSVREQDVSIYAD
jgi:hypothetical protein